VEPTEALAVLPRMGCDSMPGATPQTSGYPSIAPKPGIPTTGNIDVLDDWRLTPTQRHSALWIHGLAPWAVMLTVTFKRLDGRGHSVTEHAASRALRHLIRRINFSCFGPSKARRGWTIGVAPVLSADASTGHLHAHILLSNPPGQTYESFLAVIERCARRTRLVDQQRRTSHYRNAGGSAYLVKHGEVRMDPSLITPPCHR
jgi:hypothetical protein